MPAKNPLFSKTLWVNVVAIFAIFSGSLDFAITAEEQGALLAIVNMILRMVTRQPLGWQSGTVPPSGGAVLAILAASLFLGGCGTIPPGYRDDTTPWDDGQDYIGIEHVPAVDRSAVQVRVTDGGRGVSVGFDLLGIRGYRASEWAASAWGPLKLLSYPLDYVGYMITEEPLQTLVIGLAVAEITDDTVSDLLDDILGNDDDKDSGGTSASGVPAGSPQSLNITGNGNQVNFFTTSGTAP